MPYSTNKTIVIEARSVMCFDALTLLATACSPKVRTSMAATA